MTSRARHQQHHLCPLRGETHHAHTRTIRPTVAHRQRGSANSRTSNFSAPETWYEPQTGNDIRYELKQPGEGYIHPVTIAEVRERIQAMPKRYTQSIEVVQFSAMTRKRSLFPLYGMQWGPNIYLYPIEASLVEIYGRAPNPLQLIEAKMFGGVWKQSGTNWMLTWTRETIRDFYLNNVLIHEIGHVNDLRNTNSVARERYANWFATEYGYRVSRGRI